jgi:hypothetical protein
MCGDRRNACNIFVGKLQSTRAVGRPNYRSEDNIKMDLKDIESQNNVIKNLLSPLCKKTGYVCPFVCGS